MTSPQATAPLTLLRPVESASLVGPVPLKRERREAPRRINCQSTLYKRLALLGSLAPEAPLSFVMVKLYGLDSMDDRAEAEVVSAVSSRILNLTRATDVVGRCAADSFGVVLQGTGANAASAVAARLQFHLSQLAEALTSVSFVVSVATGRGFNARALPIAALDSLQDCG
jgi:GGDEF domain-containing protein